MRAEEARQARRRTLVTWIGAGVLAVIAVVGITLAVTSRSGQAGGQGTIQQASAPRLKLGSLASLGTLQPAPSPGSPGYASVPIPNGTPLADTASAATGGTVDGVSCQSSEQLVFHIHAHLTIFVNGSPRQIPAGIGIPGAQVQNGPHGAVVGSGTCFYWLHTHAADGIIHIESPIHRVYTLGDFFDEWGQPLGPDVLGPVHGHVVVIYNGKLYLANPRDVPLNSHAQIQVEVGTPLVAPETLTFPSGM